MIFGKISAIGTRESKFSQGTDLPVVPLWKRFFTGWYAPSLTLIIVLAICLNFWQLGQSGYSNLYYAAGTRSMLSNWHAFFFASFDPAGFISVDKPPVAFWLQVLSAKLLGFSPFSVLLPQALAGVLSVVLLAHLVRRSFGSLAGLLAALALTLTPISVITSRNNDVDSMLVLVTLLATWAVIIAAERGHLRWLLLSMILVGVGFNIKVTEAYLVVPAFVLLYLLTAPLRKRTRSWHLILAIIVLFAVSLSWSIAVDLTPPAQRPYVGSSATNSELKLAFGYNGIGRLIGNHPASPRAGNHSASSRGNRLTPPSIPTNVAALPNTNPNLGGEAGLPGPTRLFNRQIAGQISWLLPLAFLGIIVLLWRIRLGLPREKHFRGLVLWGTWFAVVAIFFSTIKAFHMYYMVMFAPAICALVGIGVAALWHEYANMNMRGLLLPLALLITGSVQFYFLFQFSAWRDSILPPTIIATVSIIALGLFALRFLKRDWLFPISSLLTSISLLVLLIAPTIWTVLPVIQSRNSAFPVAGPYGTTTPSTTNVLTFVPQKTRLLAYNNLSSFDLALVHFLETHQGVAQYLYSTTTSNYSAPTIVETGKAVMTMGGYDGNDDILTVNDLVGLIQHGNVRYFLLPGTIPQYLRGISGWVRSACATIPPSVWYQHGVAPKGHSITALMFYDCAVSSQHKPNRHLHLRHVKHIRKLIHPRSLKV